jgi:hypothetical protein
MSAFLAMVVMIASILERFLLLHEKQATRSRPAISSDLQRLREMSLKKSLIFWNVYGLNT